MGRWAGLFKEFVEDVDFGHPVILDEFLRRAEAGGGLPP
jgi:hypothetical protein